MSTIAAIAKLNALVGRNNVGPIGLIVKINDQCKKLVKKSKVNGKRRITVTGSKKCVKAMTQ